MDAIDIKYHLAKNGYTLKDIADQLGVSLPSVSGIIHRKYPSRRISQAIADAIGLPLEEVFPKYSQSPQVGANDKEAA